VIAGRPNFSRS